MKEIDKHYLALQFREKIFTKNGTEFQSFFENIMEKKYPDFEKVKPYGNKGDGGNDGFIKSAGIYYQVYAPSSPIEKHSEAAKKLQEDFEKLTRSGWDDIANIQKYIFVFNDKYNGTTQLLEEAIARLKQNSSNIEFEIFRAKHLEEVFFSLNEADIMSLGFSVDLRQSISTAYDIIKTVRSELDNENPQIALKLLELLKHTVKSSGNDKLFLEYDLLEALYSQKLEDINKAKEQYKSISTRYPGDPRAFLYLAELYLNEKDFEKNQGYLERAAKIDENCHLLKLEQLIRTRLLGEKIDIKNIDEKTFPEDTKKKSDFYRIYAQFYEDSGNRASADSFIEKAIYFNQDDLKNHMTKLSILESRLSLINDESEKFKKSEELLTEIEAVEERFCKNGNTGPRNKALFNILKLKPLLIQYQIPACISIAEATFNLSLSCYFDVQIEKILINLIPYVTLPYPDLSRLLERLKRSKMKMSDDLLKKIICQLNMSNNLLDLGKSFFQDIKNEKYYKLIIYIENNQHDNIVQILRDDVQFIIDIISTLKNYYDLRKKLINSLPEIGCDTKKRLLLLVKIDEEDYDEALSILNSMDFSQLNYYECRRILEVTGAKEAWDLEVNIIQKILEIEKNEKISFNLNLRLFKAYINSENHIKTMKLGEYLLRKNKEKNILNTRDKEALLWYTISSCFVRAQIDGQAIIKSKQLLEEYPLNEPSYKFKVYIESAIYLKNNEAENALKSVIEGIKIKGALNPVEYAHLCILLTSEIGQQHSLTTESINEVQENTFVKLKGRDKWYYLGNDNELDAIKLSSTSEKYNLFIGKKRGDEIIFEDKYNDEYREEFIELIFPIERYVLWQSFKNFQNLSKEGDLEGVQLITVPPKGDSVDLENLYNYFDDIRKKKEPFFNKYCEKILPLSMLAMSEQGLINAISRIQQENKGFINFSSGVIEEFEKQKEQAKEVIEEHAPFYIDGTSALFLSEIGLLPKISTHLPKLRVPQSVINLLTETADFFNYKPGQIGHIGFAQGKMQYSSIDKDKRESIRNRFISSIKILESKPENIGVISSANKVDCFAEQEVPDELCDACILAQKEELPILTEDFLYLRMNKSFTKKKVPRYFSSFALLRVLYEKNKIGFDEFLDYFSYLSSYRFRVLPLSMDDIEKAVLGDRKIINFSPENIKKLNLSLILSEEYGVPFKTAFYFVGSFLMKVLTDDSLTIEIAEKIFIEILNAFPTTENKRILGQMLLKVCQEEIEKNKPIFIVSPNNQLIDRKIQRLYQATEIFVHQSKK